MPVVFFFLSRLLMGPFHLYSQRCLTPACSGGAAQPEAKVFIQEFLIRHVVGTVTGEGEADHAVEDVDGGRAQVDDIVGEAQFF